MIPIKNRFQIQSLYSYLYRQSENDKFLRYLEISGTFILIAIFLFFAITPTIITISSLVGEIKSKETFIQKSETKIADFLEAQNNYAKFQEKYSLLEESYPTQPNYFNGVTNLATIFRESSLDINQIDVDLKDKVDKKNTDYMVKITGQGSYLSIMDMFKKLTNNRRLITPTTITLSQPKTETESASGSSIVSVSLESDLYFIPEGKNNGKK